MVPFDATEITSWADRPNTPHELPRLIRRLILATVSVHSLLKIPSGSSVWLPGWDGLVVVENGNAWVPWGTSAWEISREREPRDKANDDYSKRKADPKGVNASQATFVFVTPRRWTGKEQWTGDRLEEKSWADVRVLDADDLVAWLEQAPAVAHWFARLIGKVPPDGVMPLDEWWDHWSVAASPQISAELVAAGRQDQVQRIAQWFQGDPRQYFVEGDTQEEATAFLAACARNEASVWGDALLARAVFVETAEAWRGIEGHTCPLVLLRGFSGGNVSSQVAVSRGHHVLTPLGASHGPRGDGCTLPRLGRDETREALMGMGLSEWKSRSLIRSTARRLTIIRRSLINESGGPVPEWTSRPIPHSIISLILVGQWEDDHEGDRAVVAEITGQAYEQVERDIAHLVTSESPLTTVGHRWRFASHEEAWHFLAPRLTASDVSRFERIAARVFGEVSPEFELPIEKRYMTNVLGKVLPETDTLREGMARSLALLGTHPDRVTNGGDAGYVPTRVLSSALGVDKGWQIWASLRDELAVLSEASPEAFLEGVERYLAVSPSPLADLFAEEGDVLFGGTPHAGLLWALERIAWSQEHFARAAKILALLAEIDPGGRASNRPAESLRSLFLPWMRFTEASDEHRLTALRMLLESVPEIGWRLLVTAYPSYHLDVTGREPPSWRPWAQDGASQPTDVEYRAFVSEMDRLLIEHVGVDAGRWADLIGIVSDLSPEKRKQVIGLFLQHVGDLRGHSDSDTLGTKLRSEIGRHRRFPNSEWAMDQEDLDELESAYSYLTPPDPIAIYKSVFDHWTDYLDQETDDFAEAYHRVEKAQQQAIQQAYVDNGIEVIAGIAEAVNNPEQVGVAAVGCLESDLALDLALAHLESTSPKLRALALGILRGCFVKSGWPVLEEVLGRVKSWRSSPQSTGDVFLAGIPGRELWERLDSEHEDVRHAYWKLFSRPNTSAWDAEELGFAIRQLIAVNRAPDAVNWLAFSSPSTETIIEILQAIPQDLARPEGSAHVDHNILFHIAQLFEKLDQSEAIADEDIARLEIPYLSVLHPQRPDMAFHRQVCKEPPLFVQLVCCLHPRSDGLQDEAVEDTARLLAWNAIHHLRRLPSTAEDGSIDAEGLSTWVSEVRRLFMERGREVVGDQKVGQVLANAPAGADGIWPCEPVRDLLEVLRSEHIGIGFIIGKRNLRGTTRRGVFDGGRQELSLASAYESDAARLSASHPSTAKILRDIADAYKAQAKDEDRRADWADQFEF